MTTYTKRFIELSDVIGMRFKCRHCGAVMELPVKQFEDAVLDSCPNCKEDWALIRTKSPGNPINLKADFIRICNAIMGAEKAAKSEQIGFSFLLEVKDNEPKG